MQSANSAKLIAGIGIEGDRYAMGTGAYSATEPAKVRHISLISLSGIETANEWLKVVMSPLLTLQRHAEISHLRASLQPNSMAW